MTIKESDFGQRSYNNIICDDSSLTDDFSLVMDGTLYQYHNKVFV